ncbi:platelet glycoprotein V-like [Centruroides sculpturatus]|uniref:platelet glycoprotein V-like n=1 Tax=Centruroides sculpturatus TaxID=218467 RepID=UPI000C6E14E2|nr:platelet glycoprotein V-like [Centruroides sculpturatus]XP_023229751.1 platelet glycoprotein V-like [Centruroides sculpturatus]XP_023229752.1 platelet glycoprotein V-like [Centruroides sculpturatus]XP_023229754.1 platelet glycoprotein V-like [Centruroides sculpturatus]XP_023229755.1 platelet glycoprotein V-like [Centruroides sculpturatus]XP_023229756.1 platelet glycoprotein V-like [Centruroides sculpturatus]
MLRKSISFVLWCLTWVRATPCPKDKCSVYEDTNGIRGNCFEFKLNFTISLDNDVRIKCFRNDVSSILDCFSQVTVSSYRITSCGVNYFQKRRDTTRVEITESQISTNFLRNLKSLRYLSVTGSEFRNLTENALHGLSLLHLKIINCSLEFVFPKFFALPSLLTLQLSDNPLKSIPNDAFLRLFLLRYLYLNDNLLEEISPDCFRDLVSLEELNLSNNRISRIHVDVFGNLRKIKKIWLKNNLLFNLPTKLELPNDRSLTYLDLSGNRNLKNVPDGLGEEAKHLEELYLSDCNLTEVPLRLIQESVKLERLSLAGNSLEELPNDIFRDSHFLQWIDLSSNRLQNLPDSLFEEAHKLEEIRLDFNRFENVPETAIVYLSQLKLLNLSYNAIRSLPPNSLLSRLIHLETLDLSHNRLENSSFDFRSGYKELKFLNLSHNLLTKLPTVFPSFREELETMNLDRNRIANLVIPSMVPYGVVYSIRYNEIKFIGIDRLKYFEVTQMMMNIEFLGRRVDPPAYFLGGNKLVCDCFLRDFFEFLKDDRKYSVELMDMEATKCHAPVKMKNLDFYKISKNDLICEVNSSCPSGCRCFFYSPEHGIYVNCSHSDLIQSPIYFPGNTSVINLSYNTLQYFNLNNLQPRVLDTLRELDLSHNSLVAMNGDFGKSRISRLDLRSNSFKTPPKGLNNISVYFGNNPLKCHCRNLLLKEWISETTLDDMDDVTCIRENRYYRVYDVLDVDICITNGGIKSQNTIIIFLILYYPLVFKNQRI